MDLRKSALFVILAGIGLAASLVFMQVMAGEAVTRPAEYPNRQGFAQAIFFFEMAQSPDEIRQVLGEPSAVNGIHIRKVMDAVNTYDYIFMLFYPMLFAALFIFLRSLIRFKGHDVKYLREMVYAGIALAAIMVLSDMFENTLLFKISAYQSISGISRDLINTLQVATRIKSGAISLAGLILSFLYASYFGKSWKLLLPALYCIASAAGFIAISVSSARYILETSATAGGILWLVSAIHGGYWYFKSR